MKHNSMHRFFAILTAVTVWISGVGLTALAEKEKTSPSGTRLGKQLGGKEFQVVAQTQNLTLSCNPSTGNFAVEDTVAQKTYYANPLNAAEDEMAKGTYRTNMLSQLVLTAADKENHIDISYSSYSYCVIEDGLSVYAMENGICLLYYFPALKITIPMEITLQEGRLSVYINYDAIEEKGDYKLLELAVLSFFGCATPEDDGYFLLPDGSGALVDFHTAKSSYGQYAKDVYGADEYSSSQFVVRNGEVLTMPVIGACFKNGDRTSGFLTLVEEGAANARLILDPYLLKSSYENAYFNFIYRDHEKATALDRTYAEVSYELLAVNRIEKGSIRLGVDFLSDGAEYTKMANLLHEKLIRAGLKENYRANALILDIYNTVSKMGYTFGLPHKKSYCLTDFKTSADILKDFAGASAEVRLLGWDKHGALENKIHTGFQPASSAGGKKELNNFLKTAGEQGATVYLNEEISRFQKNAIGYSSFFNGAKGISEKTIRLLPYLRSTLAQKTTVSPTYLLQVEKLGITAKKALQSLPNNVPGVALSSLTKAPYADFRDPYFDKEATANEMGKAVQKASKTKKIYAEAPNWFAFPYLSVATELPTQSSNYDLFDESVPFIQLVLRGLMSISSTSLNLCGEPRINMLRAIENGSSLKFSFVGEYKELSATSLNYLYGATYAMWKNEAIAYYKEWKKAVDGLETKAITDHQNLAKDVSMTIYENGECVFVNYSDQPYVTGDVTVKPLGWTRVQKGGNEQ